MYFIQPLYSFVLFYFRLFSGITPGLHSRITPASALADHIGCQESNPVNCVQDKYLDCCNIQFCPCPLVFLTRTTSYISIDYTNKGHIYRCKICNLVEDIKSP